jgi:hypothetical protein
MRFFKSTALALVLGMSTAVVAMPPAASAYVGIGISVNFAPPALPIYDQPPIPGPGYIWTPGYWAWDASYSDYYWVPGTWILPPSVGLLWTPAWWGWDNGVYLFHTGYWGPQVGYYGGIDYGFGYTSTGYQGGYWNGNRFYYNRAANHFGNVNIPNVYNRAVSGGGGRASFFGPGGASVRPTQQQVAFDQARHIGPTAVQQQHSRVASADTALRASTNRGAPRIAATSRAGALSGAGVVAASRAGGAYNPSHAAARPGPDYSAAQRAPSNMGGGRAPSNMQAQRAPSNVGGQRAPSNMQAQRAPSNMSGQRAPANMEAQRAPSNTERNRAYQQSASGARSPDENSVAASAHVAHRAPANMAPMETPQDRSSAHAYSPRNGGYAMPNGPGEGQHAFTPQQRAPAHMNQGPPARMEQGPPGRMEQANPGRMNPQARPNPGASADHAGKQDKRNGDQQPQ